MTAPTLDDVRAWLRECVDDLNEVAHGYIKTGEDVPARWPHYAACARLALVALDDAERLEKLRHIAVDDAVELTDENAYRGSVTVTFKVSRVEVDSSIGGRDALFALKFNSVIDAARREGA